jgi:epoxide hydrolase 4
MVILLHGFPEGSYGWHRVQPLLASYGLHVIAPDQRGYTPNPATNIDAYTIDRLAADIVTLMDRAGVQQADIAGHDWGAMVAWWLAMHQGDRVRRLAILNVPHPAVARHWLRTRPRQMIRSSYAGFFQLPWVPEALLGARNGALLERTMRTSSNSGTFTPADFAEYRKLWSAPGAMTGMLNWYRASARYTPSEEDCERAVTVPTRIIWGRKDQFLDFGMATDSLSYCTGRRELVELPECTHWLHHEQPQRVAQLLAEHFA